MLPTGQMPKPCCTSKWNMENDPIGFSDGLKIGLLITGLAIWLTFYLRIATSAQAVVPPAKKSPAPIQGIKNPDQQQDPPTFHYVL